MYKSRNFYNLAVMSENKKKQIWDSTEKHNINTIRRKTKYIIHN